MKDLIDHSRNTGSGPIGMIFHCLWGPFILHFYNHFLFEGSDYCCASVRKLGPELGP
jgi:hypothetical protein